MKDVKQDLKMVQRRQVSHETGDATSGNIDNLFAAEAAVKK